MAARKNRVTLNDRWRDRIRASMLIKRLEDHALGLKNVELSATQIRAAEIVLKKAAPDLATIEHTGAGGGPIENSIKVEFVKP